MAQKHEEAIVSFEDVQKSIPLCHYRGLSHILERLVSFGPKSLTDTELLALLLARSDKTGDSLGQARLLIERFGSLPMVFSTNKELLKLSGLVDNNFSVEMELHKGISGRLLGNDLFEKPIIEDISTVINYCRICLMNSEREELRVLYLNKRNRLIIDERMQEGTVDHTPLYPREIIKRTIQLSATAIIIAHNHPSGDATPSDADIEMTQKLANTCKELNIMLMDHLIVSENDYFSFRKNKLL